jgi:ubiquinone/menaquinone biosynthesis C-methylase UbiE
LDDKKSRVILSFYSISDYHAPITKSLEEGITVLDSGCGPGTWTVEMAKSFPKSKFYGVDVAGAFPDSLPDNVELVTGNITKTIPYPDNTFDYIHQRLLFAGLTDDNWKSVSDIAMKCSVYIKVIDCRLFKNYIVS